MTRPSLGVGIVAALLLTACGGEPQDAPAAATGSESFLRGAYALHEGAPALVECATGVTFPVRSQPAPGYLEGMVRDAAPLPDETVVVAAVGRVEEARGSDGVVREVFHLDSVDALEINGACGAAAPAPPLEGTTWTAVELQGSSVPTEDPPSITLQPGVGLVGWTGCRMVTGVYTLEGGRLRFGSLDRPDLPCEGSLRVEQQFLSVLQNTGSYSMARDTLVLTGEAGPLARLVGG